MADIKERIRAASARNKTLLATLAATDHAAPDLEAHIRFLADVEFQVSESDALVRELGASRQKELREHERYHNSVMRRFLYRVGGKRSSFDAKAAKEEREYFNALTAEHRERAANDKLHAQLDAAVAVKQGLESALRQHRAAQAELDNLYHSIFAGPSGPSFPEEDEKEREANAALQEYHGTRTEGESEQQATRLLRGALEQLAEARTQLDRVLGRGGRVDMWDAHGGVTSVHEMVERNALGGAAVAASHARNLVLQAARFSLGVQPEAVPPVNIDPDALVADVIFDNMATDVAFQEKLRVAQAEVQRAAEAVRSEIAGADGRVAVLETRLRRREERLAETRGALLDVRMRAFQRVAEEMGMGS